MEPKKKEFMKRLNQLIWVYNDAPEATVIHKESDDREETKQLEQ